MSGLLLRAALLGHLPGQSASVSFGAYRGTRLYINDASAHDAPKRRAANKASFGVTELQASDGGVDVMNGSIRRFTQPHGQDVTA
jgi:hypothetical protein